MIYSMTAFSRVQQEVDSSYWCWELRAVNHRYLDVSFRLPEILRFTEPQLRTILRNKITRGKIECQLKYHTLPKSQVLSIDTHKVNALIALSNQLASSQQIANDLAVSHVLSWPGIMQSAEANIEELCAYAIQLFHHATDELLAARRTEGDGLKQYIETRLMQLDQHIEQAMQCTQIMAIEIKDRLLTRMSAIAMDVSQERMAQEIALLVMRFDVNEELMRLSTHSKEVRRILIEDNVVGRKLDFLMQELNREANTLSAKSECIELTQHAVDMKVLIEQMREQIQNIE